jgi:hypothetical protein
MRRLALLIVLSCSACVAPMPVASPPGALAEASCREFATPVTIDGRKESAHGTACLQGDGSWKIDQSVASAPVQSYVVMPPVYRPYYPPYYWSDPWFYGPTLFLGGVFIGGGWGYDHRHPGWHGAWPPRRRGWW